MNPLNIRKVSPEKREVLDQLLFFPSPVTDVPYFSARVAALRSSNTSTNLQSSESTGSVLPSATVSPVSRSRSRSAMPAKVRDRLFPPRQMTRTLAFALRSSLIAAAW